jgi:hypothetical protein
LANIKFSAVTDATRAAGTPADGEFVWTTDTKKFYRGDGSTAGGIAISATGAGVADGSTLSTGLTFPNTGLKIADTNATHPLTIAAGSDLTAARTLTITTGDASRTLTLSGDATLPAGTAVVSGGALGTPSSGTLTNCTNLPISGIAASTSAAFSTGTIELGHASDTTISRVGAGVIAVEGVTVATVSGTQTLSNKTLAATYLSGTIDGGGQEIGRCLNRVVTSVTGTLTTTSHSGCIIKTSGNVTVPTTAGFNCVIIAGGAHTVTFNGTVSAAMATGDVMTVFVESATVIHAVKTAAADKVTFA